MDKHEIQMSGSVTDRFFDAVAELQSLDRLSAAGLCREIGCDRRNFRQQRLDHSRRILRPEWLSVLVLRYGVSADWLLTGRGWMFGQ